MRKQFKQLQSSMSCVAELSICYKTKPDVLHNIWAKKRVSTSFEVAEVCRSIFDQNTIDYRESFKVIYLNRANEIIGFTSISDGGITGTVADPRMIFAGALLAGACLIVIAHNHPSGSLRPSQADVSMTEKIKHAGTLLDCRLLEHIILTSDGYYSFADEGRI